MSREPIERDDLGYLAVASGLTLYLDQPAFLIAVGLYLMFLAGPAEAAGRAAYRRLSRNRDE